MSEKIKKKPSTKDVKIPLEPTPVELEPIEPEPVEPEPQLTAEALKSTKGTKIVDSLLIIAKNKMNEEIENIKTMYGVEPEFTVGLSKKDNDNIEVKVIRSSTTNLLTIGPAKTFYDNIKTAFSNILTNNEEFGNLYKFIEPSAKNNFIGKFKRNPLEEPVPVIKEKGKEREEEGEEREEVGTILPDDSISTSPAREITTQTEVNFYTRPERITDDAIDKMDLKSVVGSVFGKDQQLTESEFKDMLKQNRDALPLLKDYITKRAIRSQTAIELKNRIKEFAIINTLEKSTDTMVDDKKYIVRPVRKPKNPVQGRKQR